MSEVAVSNTPEPRPPMSFVNRLIGVFFSPGETFEDIARKPDFVVPLIIMVVLSVAGTEAFIAKIGMEPVIRWAMEHSSRTASMPPEQLEQTIASVVKFQSIAARVGSVLAVPLVALIVALVGWAATKVIFGLEMRFKVALSITAYAGLVGIIGAIITIVLIFFGDPEHAISNPQNLSPNSLGFFLNPVETSKPLLALAGSLDVFTIWYLVLLGLGFSQATGRKAKFVPVFSVYLGLWLVWVLIKVGLSTLG